MTATKSVPRHDTAFTEAPGAAEGIAADGTHRGRPTEHDSERERVNRGELRKVLVALPADLVKKIRLDVAMADDRSVTTSTVITEALERYYAERS